MEISANEVCRINLKFGLEDIENYGLSENFETINSDPKWLRTIKEFTKIELKQKARPRQRIAA